VALLSAVPNPDPRIRKKRLVLQGDVPSPANPPSGCRFHTRCWLRTRLNNPEDCETVEPQLRVVAGGHEVACHYAEQITDAMVGELVPVAKRGGAVAPYPTSTPQSPPTTPQPAPSTGGAASAGA
jgi:peptide/nickel transport system ATP-binding protein